MMNDEFYRFSGRGHGAADHDKRHLIESDDGTVLAITVACGGTEFVVAFCRKAAADRWGVFCYEPFRRVSDPGLTRTWAEHWPGGLHIFRGVRFHLVPEQPWMMRSR